MPPRYSYWTIILDGQPTAFRAAVRDDLLPTLRQLQATNPVAVLKWFARGRVWESPEEARAAQRQMPRPPAEHRQREWRPGGEHRDPHERFKKETFQARKRRERKAADLARQSGGPRPARATSGGTRAAGPVSQAEGRENRRRPRGGQPESGRAPTSRERPFGPSRRNRPPTSSGPGFRPRRFGSDAPAATGAASVGADGAAVAPRPDPAAQADEHRSPSPEPLVRTAPAADPGPLAPAHKTACPRLRKPR